MFTLGALLSTASQHKGKLDTNYGEKDKKNICTQCAADSLSQKMYELT